jgi:hypothetical protein
MAELRLSKAFDCFDQLARRACQRKQSWSSTVPSLQTAQVDSHRLAVYLMKILTRCILTINFCFC